MVVVETPNPMRTSRLKAVDRLQLPHQVEVLDKDPEDNSLVILLPDETEAGKAVKEGNKVGLMAGAIIDAAGVSEAVSEVGSKFNGGGGVEGTGAEEEIGDEGLSGIGKAAVPGAVGDVAVAGGLVRDRGYVVDPEEEALEEGEEGGDGGLSLTGARI